MALDLTDRVTIAIFAAAGIAILILILVFASGALTPPVPRTTGARAEPSGSPRVEARGA
jgi:hypothetical protein